VSRHIVTDRFDYATNLERAGTYRTYRSAFWPPVGGYEISSLDLADSTPDLGEGFLRALADLRSAIEAEWYRVKEIGVPARRRMNEPGPVAEAMRRIGEHLPEEVDRRAVNLRATAVEDGYNDDILRELTTLTEDVAVVAGQISTWYGKEVKGLPTAFACRRDPALTDVVAEALQAREDVTRYLIHLHAHLRLGDLPAFQATRLFFMAGEGNLHPKHIAYFLPRGRGRQVLAVQEDLLLRQTHRALLEHVPGR
jgi:hypothetical protein